MPVPYLTEMLGSKPKNMNWNNIRTVEKTQHNGFEELICQLAAKEKIPEQKKFVRIGKPDGGKECNLPPFCQ